MKPAFTHPRQALSHHVSGAIKRGEAVAIAEQPSPACIAFNAAREAAEKHLAFLRIGNEAKFTPEIRQACLAFAEIGANAARMALSKSQRFRP
jgi:hypothetical protein